MTDLLQRNHCVSLEEEAPPGGQIEASMFFYYSSGCFNIIHQYSVQLFIHLTIQASLQEDLSPTLVACSHMQLQCDVEELRIDFTVK